MAFYRRRPGQILSCMDSKHHIIFSKRFRRQSLSPPSIYYLRCTHLVRYVVGCLFSRHYSPDSKCIWIYQRPRRGYSMFKKSLHLKVSLMVISVPERECTWKRFFKTPRPTSDISVNLTSPFDPEWLRAYTMMALVDYPTSAILAIVLVARCSTRNPR